MCVSHGYFCLIVRHSRTVVYVLRTDNVGIIALGFVICKRFLAIKRHYYNPFLP